MRHLETLGGCRPAAAPWKRQWPLAAAGAGLECLCTSSASPCFRQCGMTTCRASLGSRHHPRPDPWRKPRQDSSPTLRRPAVRNPQRCSQRAPAVSRQGASSTPTSRRHPWTWQPAQPRRTLRQLAAHQRGSRAAIAASRARRGLRAGVAQTLVATRTPWHRAPSGTARTKLPLARAPPHPGREKGWEVLRKSSALQTESSSPQSRPHASECQGNLSP
mmetsp:Transcript_64006/g.133454  ORF Transcript_64006/g.133454 Transcript_64006/m.133454 type:complete len:218 (+) Transcript_64006:736-1389(+)